MPQLQELIVPLKIDDSAFQGGIENSITKATAFGNIIGNLATAAITGGLRLIGNGIQTVTGFLADSVMEASEAENGLAQLNAVLKSTGGVAGVTADQALDLASSLQNVTRFSDDAILSAENMLLTFTSIGKEVFPQATETVLDMSQALGQDLKSSAVQLGKALNDPITGVTALRRVGVQFTDEQQELINGLVESGDLLGAQTIILQELQKEFGGSARAAGDTFAGKLDILKNKLSDIKEKIGGALIPVLTDLATRFSELIDTPEFQRMVDIAVAKLEEFGEWVAENLPKWTKFFEDFSTDPVAAIDNIDWATAGDNFGKGIESIFGIGRNKTDEGTRGIGQALSDGIREFLRSAMMLDEWEIFLERVDDWAEDLDGNLIDWFDKIGIDVRDKIVSWGIKWGETLGRISKEIVSYVYNFVSSFGTSPFGSLSNAVTSGRASGGPVIAGQHYNVAEFFQPEVFTPNVSGRIDKKEAEKPVIINIDYALLARLFAVELSKVIN